ncbi:MAG: hypothetical protein CMM59_02075 [Rhodospirillaceae bacterium]|nr:hypothetical protein [Rhodospirillaceae bacterium]
MLPCPCGSGALFHDCCGPIVAGESPAPTAEALMRSRYTAFTMGERAHIERTYAPEMRTLGNGSGFEPGIEWIKLEILDKVDGGEAADTGIVEFAAHYRLNGRTGVHRERSNFRREDGLWLYVDGTGPSSEANTKVGRNAPCPCGSGLKFKKCCGQ